MNGAAVGPAVRDDAGTAHPRAGDDARIVSLVPSLTELLFALDLGDRVVGRTTFCVHPRDRVSRVSRVGGTKSPRLDRIARLDASHVLVNVDENRRDDVEALERLGLRVVVTHPLAPRDNLRLYRMLGALFQRDERAARLQRLFERALARLVGQVHGLATRRVLYLIWRDPWMTVSADTYVSRSLALAGLQTVPGDGDARYPAIVLSRDRLRDVDAVLLSSEPFPFNDGHARELRAIAGDDGPPIVFVDGRITSWYGSRAIGACRDLGRLARELAGEAPARCELS